MTANESTDRPTAEEYCTATKATAAKHWHWHTTEHTSFRVGPHSTDRPPDSVWTCFLCNALNLGGHLCVGCKRPGRALESTDRQTAEEHSHRWGEVDYTLPRSGGTRRRVGWHCADCGEYRHGEGTPVDGTYAHPEDYEDDDE